MPTNIDDLEGRLVAIERVLDGVLARLGVPQHMIHELHGAAGATRYAGIGSANKIVGWLTAAESLFEDMAMCGRYAITTEPAKLRQVFQTSNDTPNFGPRYNAAPTQELPVVRFNPQTKLRSLDLLRWGLIPSWAPDTSAGARAINARCETLASKPTFQKSYQHRRCLVPATAYYEWLHRGTTKIPYAIALAADSTMAFAGLWDGWWPPHADRNEPGQMLRSFTIVTCPAAASIVHLHARMPVIVPPDRWATWLGEAPTAVDTVLATFTGDLRCWEVAAAVGNVRNDHPDLLKPVDGL